MKIFQGEWKLVKKEQMATDIFFYAFEVLSFSTLDGKESFSGNKDFHFSAGQFVSLQFGEKSWRAYSIASVPNNNVVNLLVRLIPGGVASDFLRTCQLGETLPFKAPFGHFILSDNDLPLIFCATGTGIAPLRSMILEENSQKNPREMHLYYGGRNAQDIAYLDEIPQWSSNLSVHLAFSKDERASEYHLPCISGRITEYFRENFSSDSYLARGEYYICGNGDMVSSLRDILINRGIEKERIFFERFN